MLITIVNVSVRRVPKKDKTSYSVAEVQYQKDGGQEYTQKVFSFGNKDVYQVASKAQPGECYEVVSKKNDKDFWEFQSMEKVSSDAGPEGVLVTIPRPLFVENKPAKNNPIPKSTYETPEERAERQRLIVRQSSLAQALEYTKATQPKALTSSADDIMMLAEQFATWVHMKPEQIGIQTILDMDDDIPM